MIHSAEASRINQTHGVIDDAAGRVGVPVEELKSQVESSTRSHAIPDEHMDLNHQQVMNQYSESEQEYALRT